MKCQLILLYIIATLFIALPLYSNTYEINLYELDRSLSRYDSPPSLNFSWLVKRYDLNQIEFYINQRYGAYYKYYETYLTKQREIAGKFGLSSIFLKPNFRRYENTKLIFTKNVWNDRLSFRYLAPLGDMTDFELFAAFHPSASFNIIVKSELNGESSIAAAINRPFGSKPKNGNVMKRTVKLLKKLTEIKI